MAIHESVPLLMRVADDHCALMFSPCVPFTVTPAPAVRVVCPVFVCKATIVVPIGKATDEFGGMVKVLADPTFISTNLPSSDSARV